MTGPLCNAGVCASILAGIAQRDARRAEEDARQVERLAQQLVMWVSAYNAELGLTAEQRARVPAALRAIDRLTGGAGRSEEERESNV